MTGGQNKSHAVMAQRHEPAGSLDDFPTPPWATRALIEHVIGRAPIRGAHCLEPACGRGHMSAPLAEYFAKVTSSDIADYGYGAVGDFLDRGPDETFDWVITNPPFRLAEDFVLKALPMARSGVAVLVRTVFIESVGRLQRVFSRFPPSEVAQFAERVPMVRGRLDQKASTATGYAWVVWRKPLPETTQLVWIPACRRRLEAAGDYENARASAGAEHGGPIPRVTAPMGLFDLRVGTGSAAQPSYASPEGEASIIA